LKTIYIEDILKMPEGSHVQLTGWLRSKRAHGKLVFLDLRDSTGVLQVAVKGGVADQQSLEAAASAARESLINVEGVVRADSRAPGGIELAANRIRILGGVVGDFPIRRGIGARALLDRRHLHLRSPRVTAIMKIRARLLRALRNWFDENRFIEINCPSFITAAVEGGATLFKVDYFGREVYLTQSVQFYQEAAIYGLERVYSIQPSFRAEKSKTRRHLTEFWHVEAEMAHAGLEDLMKTIERLVGESCIRALQESGEELGRLERHPSLDMLEPPYDRVRYSEALEILESKGVSIPWGSDLGADEERVLTQDFERPFFLTHFPKEAKAFYHRIDPTDNRVTLSADLLAPKGYGEVVGGGERIYSLDELMARIEAEGLDPKDYEWYLDLRRYGSVQHAGFGLGLERVLQWLLELRSIKSASLFPRTRARIYP
jgi:asparaginyl-tRNA synthetase